MTTRERIGMALAALAVCVGGWAMVVWVLIALAEAQG